LRIRDWTQSPIHNPQSPIPNPQKRNENIINKNKIFTKIFSIKK